MSVPFFVYNLFLKPFPSDGVFPEGALRLKMFGIRKFLFIF